MPTNHPRQTDLVYQLKGFIHYQRRLLHFAQTKQPTSKLLTRATGHVEKDVGLERGTAKSKDISVESFPRRPSNTNGITQRIRSINLTCQRCREENEFTMHTIFFCPAARATWCASQFPILVERLPLNFTAAI